MLFGNYRETSNIRSQRASRISGSPVDSETAELSVKLTPRIVSVCSFLGFALSFFVGSGSSAGSSAMIGFDCFLRIPARILNNRFSSVLV